MREIIFIIIFAGCLSTTYGLSCMPCSNRTCETPSCNSSGYALGICACCDVCAKPYNASCGGLWNLEGTCDKNLTCYHTPEQLIEPYFAEGSCVDSHCRAIIDVIWAMDGSESMEEKNFKTLKKFLQNATMEIYDKFGACAHVEILQYSNKDSVVASIPIEDSELFQIPFSLGECVNNVDCIQRRLDEMEQLGGQTFTYYALRRIREVELKKSSRAERSKKIVIVVTDGEASDGASLLEWYKQAILDGIIPFAIGIGEFDPEQLQTIANGGKSNERVFSIDSLSNLNISKIGEVLVNGIWNETVHENITCAYPEVYSPCTNPDCDNTCENPFGKCVADCKGVGCVCAEGYVRMGGENQTCVKYGDCPSCPYPQVYKTCTSNCPPTCETPNPFCIQSCAPAGCVCAEGYVQKSDNDTTCVRQEDCKMSCVDPFVENSCPSYCPATCDDPNPTCIQVCAPSACTCPKGYLLSKSDNGTTCVLPENCPAQKKALLEIIFVIDGSGSIGESNFAIVKKWLVNQTVNIYEAFGNSARVEVLQYSNKDNPWDGVSIGDSKKFVIPFVLGDCVNNASCFTPLIMNMPYLNGGTYTYYALRRVMEVEFPKSPSYATSTKAVIVITDGEANDSAFLRGWHDKYKHMLNTIAIGIGQYEKFLNQLQDIANGGTGNDRVFTYADFGALRESSSDIITALINSTSSCDDPFVENSCPSYCPATCDDPTPICIQVCAPPGCTCPKGHLLSKSDNGTTCVLPENCPEKKCIFPEVHTNCALPCLKTCSDPNPICPEICQLNQCVCAEGYIRKSATNLTCILQDECPEPCEPKNCGIVPLCFEPNCPAYPSAKCKSNYCDCTQWYEDGFGRRVDCNNNTCQYPMIRSDCGSACPTTCETVNADYPIACTLQCIVGACVCPKGMVLRSLTDRVCVTPGNCTKPPTVCPYPKMFQLCPSACPATCDNPNPGVCTKSNRQCAEDKCVCPPDHVLFSETDGRCVHAYECPARDCMATCAPLEFTGCSSKLSEAWSCHLSNWICAAYEWKLSMEEWWFTTGCYSEDGRMEYRWREAFSCPEYGDVDCVSPGTKTWKTDAFGCQRWQCGSGGYRDTRQLEKMWKIHSMKYQQIMKLYNEAKMVCGGGSVGEC
ncbi:uncharacterized protein LOC120326987 isoform X1 [Styela clava]